MAYIGRYVGTDKTTKTLRLDSFESQFNGAQTVFSLTSSNVVVYPSTAQSLLISLNGVIQEPITAYTISENTITFTSAPAANSEFFGVLNGNQADFGYNFGQITVADVATFSANVTIAGNVSASALSGNGISLTSLNASNLGSGTVPLARLDANVLLTTSTTGINASALSTGTVPDGRLSGTYTNITANTALTANQSTYLAGAAVTGNSTALTVGANVYVSQSTVFVGNSTINAVHTSTTLGVYANSTVNTIISAAAANSITINGLTVGYLEVPQNSQSAAYGLVLADSGKHIFHPASDNNARTYTIPAHSNIAYPTGTVLTFVSMANTVTIAITTDTMYLAGNGATGSRTLAANGIATALKMNSSAWLISGTGLT